MNKQELKSILDLHKKWLNGRNDGKRADFRDANLEDIDFSRANLIRADLKGADLSRANLKRADLIKAYVASANLDGVNFSEVDEKVDKRK